MSRFADVEEPPKLEAFDLISQYNQDVHPNKVNLSVGVYRTEDGGPFVMPVVRRAEEQLTADSTLNHDYNPTFGWDSFRSAASLLLLGDGLAPLLADGRAFGMQTVGGTGALRLGADFLLQQLGYRTVYFSDPTWGNHLHIFRAAGFQDVRAYRYWDAQAKGLDFRGMLEDLRAAPRDAVVVLHVCAHNPTGTDPTRAQWQEVADVMERGRLFPFFDCSFQGMASGDVDEDVWPLRHFVGRGFELFCAQSFSKNFGLYSERPGNLLVVASGSKYGAAIRAQTQLIVRGNYSYPADHGGRIVSTVLTNTELCNEWKRTLMQMCQRFVSMRQKLVSILDLIGTPGKWSHITRQIGMVCTTALTPSQCKSLVKDHHVYLLASGRINISCVNLRNVDYVAMCINKVTTSSP